MRQRRLLAYGTLVVTLLTPLFGASPATAQPAPPAPPAAPPAAAAKLEAARHVTLITGDRVTVQGEQITVSPRDGIHFVGLRQGESNLVIPSDAIPLLKADRLDKRLFDVTALVDFGFDELSYLPLVVSDATAVRGLSTGPKLEAVDGFATKVPLSDLAKSWQTTRTSLATGKIWLDGVRRSTLDVSVPRIGAPVAWAAGLDGSGVTVAVIDSGIDDSHPDLAGKVVARRNFVPERETALDLNGHGTHVSSILAGSGDASGGKNKGVAPGVRLMDGKACFNRDGYGTCPDSAVIAAMQWAAESGAKVVNMSLGDPDSPGLDPMEQAVNDLTAQYGTLFVVAAGNAGFGTPYRVSSPSTADAALSVANWTKDGQLNPESLPGPRLDDYAVKPDIAAPGTDINAARAPGAASHLPEGQYVPLSGTSMASPHVAGAAALLAQAHPDWKAAQYKEVLMASATPNPAHSVFEQGSGYVDVGEALRQQVTVTPASLNVGALTWPHTEEPSTRTVTYHNRSDQPVSLELALAGDAPAGLLTLSATTLDIPAGRDASVEVTVDERAADTYGVFSGRLTATGGDVDLQTPFSVFQEPPAADIAVATVGKGGVAPAKVLVALNDLKTGAYYEFYEPAKTLRVPLDSSWSLTAYVDNGDGTRAVFKHSQVVADKDRKVVLDVRQTRPIKIRVPDEKARAHYGVVSVSHKIGAEFVRFQVDGNPSTIYTADLGPANQPGVSTQIQAVFEGRARNNRPPDVYQLGWHIAERFTTGFFRRLDERDLATIDVEYAQNATGVVALRHNIGVVADEPFTIETELPPVTPPARRTEYFNSGMRWRSSLIQATADEQRLWVQSLAEKEDRLYRPGNRYEERWNGALLQTSLVPEYPGLARVVRAGDIIQVRLGGSNADGAGHIGTVYRFKNDRLALYRDGETLGEANSTSGDFTVGAEPARYRLSYGFEPPEPHRLSRQVRTEWTFTSSTDKQGPLPLTSIGFHPELELDNSVRAGGRLTIPLTFVQQPTAGRIASVTTWVSFDDGRTWIEAATAQKQGKYEVAVRHPRQPGFVALRATAVDDAGNSVTTTIHRAYELR